MPYGFGRSDEGNLPPGSMGWPILGEALAYARSPHTFIETRAKKHGSIFKTRILGLRVICFVGAEPFDFYADNPNFVRSGAAPSHVQKLLYQSSLPLVDGLAHSALRSRVVRALMPQALGTYLEEFERLLQKYVKRWESAERFSWVHEFKLFSAAFCSKVILGEESDFDGDELLAESLDQFIAGLNAFPINLRFNTYGKSLRRQKQLLGIIDSAIERHRRQVGSAENSMLHWILSPGESEYQRIPGDSIRAQLLHTMFAAYGGMSRVLALLAMNLGQHADVRQRVEQEVATAPAGGSSSIETLVGLQYLDAVTKEVRRQNRLFATNFFGKVTQRTSYEGYDIPVGWNVTGAIYQTMQDDAFFPDAERFDPGRFTDAGSTDDATASVYIPHGGGSPAGHRCPAEDFTTLCMQQAAIVLLRSHQWELIDEQDLTLTDGASPMPRDGIKVRFWRKPR